MKYNPSLFPHSEKKEQKKKTKKRGGYGIPQKPVIFPTGFVLVVITKDHVVQFAAVLFAGIVGV